jgi:hypothetical protein
VPDLFVSDSLDHMVAEEAAVEALMEEREQTADYPLLNSV